MTYSAARNRDAWYVALKDGRFECGWWPKNRIYSPQAKSRITDYAGCVRFAKRHDLPLPTVARSTPEPSR